MYKLKQKPEDFIVNEITNIKLKDKGKYAIFLLKKENYTNERAVQKIAEKLRIPRKFIGYAGNKDKVAVTTQYISIKNSKIKRLELKDIKIELESVRKHVLKLIEIKPILSLDKYQSKKSY